MVGAGDFFNKAAVPGVSRGLAGLGRQGTRAIAAIVFIAIALPPVGAVLRPFVTEAVFALLCLAFLRGDAAPLVGYVPKTRLRLVATAGDSLLLAIPCCAGWVLSWV